MKKWTSSSEQLEPDAKYNSKLVSKFINSLMADGRKSAAQRIFYDAMEIIRRSSLVAGDSPQDASRRGDPSRGPRESGSRAPRDVLEVFETAINNAKPLIEVRSKRIGGASYQVPMQVNPKRQQSLAFRWIIQSARAKKGKPMRERLASELTDAYNKTGGAMTTRENIHRMAEANKAFAHFAW